MARMWHGSNRPPHRDQGRPMSVKHQETRQRHWLKFRVPARGPISIPPGLPIQNQRIAVLDVASGQLRQISPENLHIYDYDWSPDDKTFVFTAAPGPGDNNWSIAQIYTIDISNGSATSIYKPSLQVAVPRWS